MPVWGAVLCVNRCYAPNTLTPKFWRGSEERQDEADCGRPAVPSFILDHHIDIDIAFAKLLSSSIFDSCSCIPIIQVASITLMPGTPSASPSHQSLSARTKTAFTPCVMRPNLTVCILSCTYHPRMKTCSCCCTTPPICNTVT